ncbi:MAG: NAD(P)-dependent alcohol dehydrogenase [Saprospiraceae bacterium]
MRAVFCTKYGTAEVLKIKEIDRPQPKEGEILIKVVAASVTTADSMMRKGEPQFSRLFLGWKRPKNPIVGTGFAGIIKDKGENVDNFKVGDEVFGETGLTFSSNAEYVVMSAKGVVLPKPSFLSFKEAAPMCDGALTSFNFLKGLAKIKAGQTVLINGASGSLGVAAIQIAKSMGAIVTGVCSTKNIALVQSLGADNVIDYTKNDFTTGSETYDVIYDTIGKSSFSKCKKILVTNGIYMSPVLDLTLIWNMMSTSIFGKKKAIFQATGMRSSADLNKLLKELLPSFQQKKIKMVIDKIYPLKDAIKAHEYVDTGRKRGNVVLLMEG